MQLVDYPLENGFTVTVDAADVPLLDQYRWRAYRFKNTHYAVCDRSVEGRTKRLYMHRLILGLHESSTPIVDHEDGNGLNNSRRNIAAATYAQNAHNRDFKSGKKYRGVFKQGNGFIARVGDHYGGFFVSEIAAALAHDKLAVNVYGNLARLNFNLDFKSWPLNRFLLTL
ncbi:AP2/ERF family transcription factor [Paraburkholderia gardini]|uniref:hypothetical protein n=1 Tax=Paraburkholderia gardini TaxID=2823469 RepID=UPI001D9BC89C|nr:hypothetical protein [Paraburkholderia gardini]CAG4889470.1 hypothetical protein R69919_00751 [Paraburkholderia gardini]